MTAPLPVIVNPAAGPDQPVLKLLNRGLAAAGREWDLHLTRRAGDAERLAAQFRAAGAPVVAVCGGDGTVKEAAKALAGGETALAILPGGTGNALARELGLPLNLEAAAALAGRPAPTVRAVDLGRIGGHLFVLRASLGLETALLRGADRALKDQLGQLAYPLAAWQTIPQVPFVDYHLVIDGREIGTRGVQCTIANSAQLGVSGLTLAQGVSVSDGWLDVIVLSAVDVAALVEIATSNFLGADTGVEIQHWRGRTVTVAAEPAQAVAIGGDVIAQTPVTAEVVPGALRVVAPAP